MKASIDWLRDYAQIEKEPKELGDILTMTGTKVETIEEKGNDIKKVVVGKILEIEKHPDADKLVVTKVDVKEQIVQIVTGANNIKVGDIIPIAKDGASLPGGITIKTGKLRGIESCGMMCSLGELGLDIKNYPNQVEHGIMILPKEYEKELGKDIVEVLNLRDCIIDFEITPNRPDCLSIEGIGREVAISLGEEFKNPHQNIDKKIEEKQTKNENEIEGLSVEIQDPDLCYRYLARVIKNVKIEPSPEWLTKRLESCGVRSINNIVDITNYVMLEMGQPMHAFDIESIQGKHITVRRAKKEEKIITLDKQERILDESMLVIADTEKPVAIAGVMGGLNSEIEEDTKMIVFESAVFYGGSVRKTAKKVGLRTEASSRFEKGLSPENAQRAIERAIELVELLEAGTPIEGKIDVYPTKQETHRIKLEVKKINDLLGIKASQEEMIDILEKLEMKIEKEEEGQIYIVPPYFRTDIIQLADLSEEILRFHGYDTLESTQVSADGTLGIKTKQQKIEGQIRNLLVNIGLSEIYTYGFMKEEDLAKVNLPEEHPYRKEIICIQNPLSEDYTIMRTTTIPGMMQMIANNNNKKNEQVQLFDISRIYTNKAEAIEKEQLPIEENIITIGMYGESIDFYQLKGVVENILEVAGVTKYDVVRQEENPMYHPGRCANIKVGIDSIATLGEIHPIVLQNYDITRRVYVAEINLDKMVKYTKAVKKYAPVPKFPSVERDIALVVEEEIEVGEITKIIEKKAKKMLEEAKLFDVYRSEKVGENKKSVAYSLKFRVPDRTLTDNEINEVMNQIQTELKTKLNADLRS